MHISRTLLLALGSFVAVSAVAGAAVQLYFADASLVESGVADAPVVFSVGPDATDGAYVSGWTVTEGQTSFAGTIRGVPEMVLVLTDLFRVTNRDSEAHSIQIHAEGIDNIYVEAYKVEFFDGAVKVGEIDLLEDAPTVTLASMSPGAVYTAKVTFELKGGASNDNAATASALTVTVL